MKVILTMDVPEVGSRGDRLDVSAGYARNYLLPRRLAVQETTGALRVMAEEDKLVDVRTSKAASEARKIADFLKANEVFTTLQMGREGKAFGSVTSKELAVMLRKAGLEVDRRRIVMDTPIRRLGVFEVPLSIHPDVDTKIRVFVDRAGGSKDGAQAHQAVWDAAEKARAEAERVEAEARVERAREAEEAQKAAIEKATARRAREEEAARAKVEAEERAREAAVAAVARDAEPREEKARTGDHS